MALKTYLTVLGKHGDREHTFILRANVNQHRLQRAVVWYGSKLKCLMSFSSASLLLDFNLTDILKEVYKDIDTSSLLWIIYNSEKKKKCTAKYLPQGNKTVVKQFKNVFLVDNSSFIEERCQFQISTQLYFWEIYLWKCM